MIDEAYVRSCLRKILDKVTEEPLLPSQFIFSDELGQSGCRIGLNGQRYVTLLVPTTYSYGIELARLLYVPSARVEFYDESKKTWSEEKGYIGARIETDAEERVLLGVYSQIADSIDSGADATQIPGFVAALRDLFSALERPSLRSEIGLWGELFVMYEARDPLTLAEAWVAEADTVFDFAVGGNRLEVKTTSGALRRHTFSISQLEQHSSTETTVVSIVTTEVSSGVSAFDLLDQIQVRIRHNPQLQQLLLQKAVRIAGASIKDPRYFDPVQARGTLRLLQFASIPQPRLSAGIIDLTWTVLLSTSIESDNLPGNTLAEALRTSGDSLR